MTAKDVMDAPSGEPDAAVWRQAFWYRGSAVPGQASTALIAGHVNNQVDDPGVFARLDELQVGDAVTVHDTRDGSDVTFTVTSAHSYTLAEAAEPEVLREIYGAGPSTAPGRWPPTTGSPTSPSSPAPGPTSTAPTTTDWSSTPCADGAAEIGPLDLLADHAG